VSLGLFCRNQFTRCDQPTSLCNQSAVLIARGICVSLANSRFLTGEKPPVRNDKGIK
jgi:hypothetical protein